jgi:hypothetical protein
MEGEWGKEKAQVNMSMLRFIMLTYRVWRLVRRDMQVKMSSASE